MRKRRKNLHGLPLVTVSEVGVRESAFDETTEDGAAAGPKCTRSKDESRDLTCRTVVAEEYEAFACKEGVEEDDYRVGECTVGVEVGVKRSRDVLGRGKGLY